MGWKKISVEMMPPMTTDQDRTLHLTRNPHGEYDLKDWESMTEAQRVLAHFRMHMKMRSQAGPNGRRITHDHPENKY